jgi:hypothetical protein
MEHKICFELVHGDFLICPSGKRFQAEKKGYNQEYFDELPTQ